MNLTERTLAMIATFFLVGTGSLIGQDPDFASMTLRFSNITGSNVNQTVVEQAGNEKQVEYGDYDNDGDLDVVIAVALSDFGQRRNKLYRNDQGVLNEVSGAPVIPGFSNTDTSRSAFFRDFDQDGFLDIIIVNDANSGTSNNDSPGKTKYYRNVNGSSFINESGRLANQTGSACGGTAEDFDNNGFCDLMMCNYPGLSQDSLGLNNINGAGPGQFTEVTNTNYPAESFYGVHSEAADMNGDGKLDFLVGNQTSSPAFIYYNDNDPSSSGVGDFRYTGPGASSTVLDFNGGSLENALVPADFNGDGMMDFYYANAGIQGGASGADAIYVNTGNDASNRAIFVPQPISADLNSETIKVTCNDLDGDGRADVIVMSEVRRPYIYRNTSANGAVSFIEWTPFQFTTTHDGWQAKSGDVTGNGRPDVLVGANSNDFLFENLPSNVIEADSLTDGVLPGFHNSDPIAISGNVGGDETHAFVASGMPIGAKVSILVRSTGDLSLTVNQNGSAIGSSTRKGENVDEAIQLTLTSAASLEIEIHNESSSVLLGDIDGNGEVNLLDVAPFIDLISNGGFNEAGDLNGDGIVSLLDVQPFVDVLSGGAGSSSDNYVIEFLSRTN